MLGIIKTQEVPIEKTSEKGVALILTMILLLVMSVMAVSFMFLSQTETWSTFNYRLMSQSRDGAEAGVNAAANYLINTYAPPTTSGTDPLSNYAQTTAAVQYSGSNVMLSASSSHTSVYPVSTVKTAFNTAGQGSLAAGTTTVNYNAWAELITQQQIKPFGCASAATCGVTIQTWRITSDGTISSIRNAKEEVSATLERQITPVFTYAAFATSCADGALDFGGGANTDSYTSVGLNGNGTPHTDNNRGDVGTNGSLNANGNPTSIFGSLSTPRNGVSGTSSCLTGAQAVLTGNAGQLHGGIIELPQIITYPTPSLPSPLPGMGNQSLSGTDSDCNALTGCSKISGGQHPVYQLAPGTYQNLNLSSSSATYNLVAGTYNINSFQLTGSAALNISSGPVILNITGCSANNGTACTSYITSPLDFTGGTLTNWPPISTNLQIQYAGTGTIKLAGGSQTSGVLYAPNASIQLNSNNGHWWGAVIGNTVSASGGVTIDYDRALASTAYTLGNYMLSKFDWKKN